MRKIVALAMSAAVLLPASPVAAIAANVETMPARVVTPAPVLPASSLGVPSLPTVSLPGVALPKADILAIGRNLPAPSAAAAAAAPESARADFPVAAQAQLARAAELMAPKASEPGAAAPSAARQRETSEKVWSGAVKHESSDAVDAAVPAEAAAPSGLSKASSAAGKAALFGAAAVPLPKAAGAGAAMAQWLTPLWQSAQPYVMGGAVLAATYGVHKGVRWAIDHLAKRGKWDPNAADTARFAGTIGTWSLGAAIGLHLAGASTTALITGFGVALSLAVKKTVGNLLQGVVFLVNRPFLIGEKIRVGDTMYQVEDMQLQYVTMRVIGKLAADKPDPVPPGVKLVPMKDVDPLRREADDKGYKWVLEREVSPGPAPKEGIQQVARQKYSNLAGASITVYRPYTRGHVPQSLVALHLGMSMIPRVKKPSLPVREVLGALGDSKGALARAAIWMAVSLAFIPLLPVAKALLAYKAVALLYPWVHGAVSFWATRQVVKFFEKFIPALGAKLGWSRQAVIVTKLLFQAGIYFVGLSATMRALGLEWRSVATSLGATAAAISFASSDMLGNLAQALLLRFDRPFNIGDTLRVGTDVGVVQEMNMFYVVLKVADGSHTLVPYSVIDATELDTYESATGPNQTPK